MRKFMKTEAYKKKSEMAKRDIVITVLVYDLARAKVWIEENCCEKSCKKNREKGCFSCEAWEFLESLI